jgi:aspartyl-tRNA(Asn)/glutamyl-tRNA(Gln) amidotransferase subunit A
VTVFERDLGCTVERADPGWEDPYEALVPLVVCESDLAGLRRLADELGERMSPHLVDVLRVDWAAEQLTGAVVRRKAVYDAAWRFFRAYDLLVTPTLAVPPLEHGQQGPASIDGRRVDAFYWLSFTFPFTVTGQRRRRCRPGSPTTACRSGCRSWDGGWTTRWCCAPRRPMRPRRRGGTAGR